MKVLTLLLCVWAAVGFAVFAWDTVTNEHIWSRNQDSKYLYAWCGPIIWGLYVFIWIVGLLFRLTYH